MSLKGNVMLSPAKHLNWAKDECEILPVRYAQGKRFAQNDK